MTNQVIPAQAVEAVAKALWTPTDYASIWEEEFESYQQQMLDQARLILEAAAPHMQLRELLDGVQREIDEAKTMTDILVDHQRQSSSACLCGWAKLGHSHPEHQADALSAAGFRRPTT